MSAMVWRESAKTPPPRDGTKVVVSDGPDAGSEAGATALLLSRKPGEAWTDGTLAYGDADSEDFKYWMPVPPPPTQHGDDGWVDAKATPPAKDGTTFMMAFVRDSKTFVLPLAWISDWASSDLGLPGTWSDGVLLHANGEPDFWQPMPPFPEGPDA